MDVRQTRMLSLVACVSAAALGAPLAAGDRGRQETGSSQRSNPTARNDVGHFGSPASSRERLDDATSRNDAGHFGAQDRAARAESPSAPTVVVRVDGGFDWSSAGVGAAGGIGVALVAAAAASAVRRGPDRAARA